MSPDSRRAIQVCYLLASIAAVVTETTYAQKQVRKAREVVAAQSRPPRRVTSGSEEVMLGPVKNSRVTVSHRWLAYVISEGKTGADTAIYIELNGKRLGPYEEFGGDIITSPDGEHIAYAAKERGQWCVVLDGVQKWCHRSLGWGRYNVMSGLLDGSGVIRVGTDIVRLLFSPQGSMQYSVKTTNGKWAEAVNGRLGPEFENTSDNVQFVAGEPIYIAWPKKGSAVLVHGRRVFGPFDTVTTATVSADGLHFAAAANTASEHFLIVDGVSRRVPGKVLDWELGPNGQLIYSREAGSRVKVSFQGKDLPDDYDRVEMLAVSSDGKRFALWVTQGSTKKVITYSGAYEGFDGSYFYEIGHERYTFFWSRDGSQLAYCARQSLPGRRGQEVVLALNGRRVAGPGEPPAFSDKEFNFLGFGVTNYVDGARNVIGKRANAPEVDRRAFVECVQVIETAGCNPWTARMAQGKLVWLHSADNETSLVMDGHRKATYPGKTSQLFTSPDGRHYAFVVKTDSGYRVVLDGSTMSQAYDSYHSPRFQKNEAFVHVGIRNGQVYGVRYPLFRLGAVGH